MTRSCEFRHWFTSCGAPAAGTCQYCGRAFCREHGSFGEEHQEICNRKICREKQADVATHQAYKAEVRERNSRLLCGAPGCPERFAGQCSRCGLLFCESHLLDRMETVRTGYSRVSRPVSVCDHCWGRRRLWERR